MGIVEIADIILYYPINIRNLHSVITLYFTCLIELTKAIRIQCNIENL